MFLVRKGNPKGIKDWGDLVKKDVSVITPNPKTSGGARWNFLAAWAYGLKSGGSEDKAKAYVQELFKHVPVLDTGARGSTITFVNNGQGDVLLAWENEAFLALKEDGGSDKFEIVVPSLSILAEPPVAVVDKNADKKGNTAIATEYLKHLYSPAGQKIAAENFYRPRDAKVAAEFGQQFPKLDLVTIDKDFGGWKTAQPKFFNDGGVFDQIYQAQ
ncbi:Sulfate-binding protein precursor [compost metagenome]